MPIFGGPFTTTKLLLCEGREDCGFLEALINHHGLGGFDIRDVRDLGSVSGISGFRKALEGGANVTGFAAIKHVVLMADKDSNETDAFNALRDQVSEANRHKDVRGIYPVPTAPTVPCGTAPNLQMTVLLLPLAATTGALETVLWDVVKRLHPTAASCVEQLIQCSGILSANPKWGPAKLDKTRMRAIISILHRKNPAMALAKLWRKRPDLVPVSEPEFTSLVSALSAI